uniref:Uncharacterized protein n=1 Tax=Glossina pallidipes TaxID=7398 RepID=A0A1B0AJB3_GLOPL
MEFDDAVLRLWLLWGVSSIFILNFNPPNRHRDDMTIIRHYRVDTINNTLNELELECLRIEDFTFDLMGFLFGDPVVTFNIFTIIHTKRLDKLLICDFILSRQEFRSQRGC